MSAVAELELKCNAIQFEQDTYLIHYCSCAQKHSGSHRCECKFEWAQNVVD